MKRLIRSLYIIAFAIVFQNCAPSVLYLQIEEKKGDKYVFPDEITDISIFPVISISQHDSVRIVNAAFGMAEKFESDRELEKEAIGVFAVPLEEFAKIGEDLQVKDYKTYAMGLMSKTGALNQIYLHNLKLGKYSIEKYPYNNAYEIYLVNIPYNINVAIYNPLIDSLYYSNTINGNINIQADESSINSKDFNAKLTDIIPDICKNIGKNTAEILTPQWETKEKIIIYFPDNSKWVKAAELAEQFKFEEAISIWIPLAETENVRKSSFAAYNIALACQLMENYNLAYEWIRFGLKKFPFKELEQLRIEVKNNIDEQRNNKVD